MTPPDETTECRCDECKCADEPVVEEAIDILSEDDPAAKTDY